MTRTRARIKRAPAPKGEHNHQALFIQRIEALPHPVARRCFAIPNGAIGNKRTRQLRFWREGVRSGVPDLFIAHPSGRYHGLFIEFKFGSNTTSDNQEKWLKELASAGYRCAVCFSADEAWEVLLDYLGVKP